ncbi:MAG: Do family serine endopeptidase [Deltaproteobacteria bacterium]
MAAVAVFLLFASPSAALAANTEGDLWHDRPSSQPLVPQIAKAFPSLAPLVRMIKPAVVNVSTTQRVHHPAMGGYGPGDPFGQFFQQFFGGQMMPQQEVERQSLGSGFFIDERGYLLTNNHVIEGADVIRIKLADGREFPAKVVGTDPKTDVALVRVSAKGEHDFPYLYLGDSDALAVGDWVIAIGNPFGLELSVTHGMVSAKERSIGAGPYDDFIQSDALINPGNSGGPLFDMNGAVVGINTAITSRGQGIGFAVPINMAKQLLPQLATGHIVRGWLGIGIQPLSPNLAKSFGLESTNGALIADVMRDGPAARGGLKRGDIVVSLDGKSIKTPAELTRAVAALGPGSVASLAVIRDGGRRDVSVKIGRRPEEGPGEGPPQEGQAAPGADEETKPDALGLSVRRLEPEAAAAMGMPQDIAGVLVSRVAEGSPAADAGIEVGDVIVEVNRRPIRSLKDYRVALEKTRAGELARLRVQRKQASIFFAVKLK